MAPLKINSYSEVLNSLANGRRHILLGNGFSIGCDPVFHYGSLYDAAVRAGLSRRAQLVFERIGTNNFEGVMHLLDESHWIARTYGLVTTESSGMLDDMDIVKTTLVEAVAKSHLAHTGKVPDEKKECALKFLDNYHNIFTTNYDLLPYWINMYASPHRWGDGFRADEDDPDAPYVLFTERLGSNRGLFFLHGALHLHVVKGELRKHTWSRTGMPLTELIQQGLEKKNYPLFIAEGSADKKLQQIQNSGYLWYCLDKLARIKGPLVVYGHALGPSDQHIVDIIAGNQELSALAISIYGDPKSTPNQKIFAAAGYITEKRRKMKRAKPITIYFFDSASAPVWNA